MPIIKILGTSEYSASVKCILIPKKEDSKVCFECQSCFCNESVLTGDTTESEEIKDD